VGASARTDGGQDPSQVRLPPATAQVTRQNLVETQEVDGTLGYGDEHQLTGGLQGVVTRLAAEGSTISRGEALYRVDNRPVVLMYGGLPLYRDLRAGIDDGPDVKELEDNLKALGYTGFTVDEAYTDATADAVRAWQEDVGLAPTGAVEVGRVVMAPGPVRVSKQRVEAGGRASPGQPVLTYTATARLVTVDLDVDDQELADKGARVTVELPGGRTVRGTVASVGTVARAEQDGGSGGTGQGGGASGSDTATIEVTVTLDDSTGTGRLDQAPVTVRFVSQERKGVLTVPISALLVLRAGGYGVEVVQDTSTQLVPVEVGMFAGGRVEVRGKGITAGTTVGVAPS
jgi:membrane fusion protein, multidrug efflux system